MSYIDSVFSLASEVEYGHWLVFSFDASGLLFDIRRLDSLDDCLALGEYGGALGNDVHLIRENTNALYPLSTDRLNRIIRWLAGHDDKEALIGKVKLGFIPIFALSSKGNTFSSCLYPIIYSAIYDWSVDNFSFLNNIGVLYYEEALDKAFADFTEEVLPNGNKRGFDYWSADIALSPFDDIGLAGRRTPVYSVFE